MNFNCFFIRSKKSSSKWSTKEPPSISTRTWFQWLRSRRRTFCMWFAKPKKWSVWISKINFKKWKSSKLRSSIQLPRCLIWREPLQLGRSISLRITIWSQELVSSKWPPNWIQFVSRLSKRSKLLTAQSVQMVKFWFWTFISPSRNSLTITMDRIDSFTSRLRTRRSKSCSPKSELFQTSSSFISPMKSSLSKTRLQLFRSCMDPTWIQIISFVRIMLTKQ